MCNIKSIECIKNVSDFEFFSLYKLKYTQIDNFFVEDNCKAMKKYIFCNGYVIF